MKAEEAIRGAFGNAGVTGYLHAVDIDTGRSIGAGADTPVVLASVFKLPLLVEFHRQCEAGDLDPSLRVRVPASGRTSGPTGLAVMWDEAELSLRDLAYLMIAISDNAAADVLCDRVGLRNVNDMLRELGFEETRVTQSAADMLAIMVEDLGPAPESFFADPEAQTRMRVLDPSQTNRSTPREMTRLLTMVWRDELPGGEQMRRLLGLQVWPHRLPTGFPYDDVRVSGKTGTLPTLRTEVGVVEYPDGGRYAIAVFTRSANPSMTQPRTDAVIGTTARLAVDALRSEP